MIKFKSIINFFSPLLKKGYNKAKKFIKYVWQECKDWRTFLILLIVMAVVYSPVWFCYLLYGLFGIKWCLAVATACLAFWAGPFTPFFPICLAITCGIKRIIAKMQKSF